MRARAWFEAGMSTIEMIGIVVLLLVLVGVGATTFIGAQQNEARTATMQQLVGIVAEAKAASSSAGAILDVAPSGTGSVITLYTGWTITSSALRQKYTTTVPVGLLVGSGPAAATQPAFDLYVYRNGSFYAQVGAAQQPCAALALGVVDVSVVGSDAYPLSCEELAVSAGVVQ
jgi:hypothetical protein